MIANEDKNIEELKMDGNEGEEEDENDNEK